jgi:hypothetical protein
MAFVELSSDPGLAFFCNVHGSVGQGLSNRRDDVLLVQWLLRQYFSKVTTISPPPGPMIQVDGSFGRQTGDYIKAFQTGGKAGGHSIAVDGRVDRAQGVFGALSGTQYTIIHMNNGADGRRPELARRFWTAADMPLELRNALIASSRR